MKIVFSVLLLTALLSFMLMSCSDQPAPIAGPPNQAGPQTVQGLLGKVNPVNFGGIETPIPLPPLDPGKMFTADGKVLIRGMVVQASWKELDNPLVKGTLVLTVNLTLDAITGEGPESGKFTLYPDDNAATGGGVWEVSWQGFRTKVGESEWATNIKDVGHGKGGTIEGMQLFADEVIHTYTLFATDYVGDVKGFIQTH